MKKRVVIAVASFMSLAALAFFIGPFKRQDQVRAEDSPAGKYRIVEPAYSRLANAAQFGDCEAAYKLGRHHVFFTLKTNEAIRWYRLAAKCPHAAAKGELVAILMHFDTEDAEVDRLLSEIAEIDPKAAENDKAAVESVRSLRAQPSP